MYKFIIILILLLYSKYSHAEKSCEDLISALKDYSNEKFVSIVESKNTDERELYNILPGKFRDFYSFGFIFNRSLQDKGFYIEKIINESPVINSNVGGLSGVQPGYYLSKINNLDLTKKSLHDYMLSK